MIFFTPDIGTLLKLEQDWTFTLFSEYRNRDLFNKLKQLGKISNTDKNQVVDLPKGLVVKVDRVYIRKGLSQYSSITFTIPKPKNKSEKEEMPLNLDYTGSKFWVKLHECNGIEFSPLIGNKETFESFQKIYQEIERDASEKFGVQKCTQMLASINRALGPGKNINNFKTHLRTDQFLNVILSKLKDDDTLSDYLKVKFIQEMRDYKIRQII
jgi:hypothetical protein